jgi:hypothetical protein
MLRRPDRASSQHGRKVCDSDITSDGLTRRIHYQTLISSLASVLYRSFLFGNFPIPTLSTGEYGRTRKHLWKTFSCSGSLDVRQQFWAIS